MRRGFTLVELSIVVGILGVLVLIAAPRYSAALWNYRSEIAARRLAADLEMTRDTARAQSRSSSISFLLTTYSVAGEVDLDTSAGAYSIDLSAEPYRIRSLVTSITLGGLAVYFDGFGVPSSTAQFTIRTGTAMRVVRLDALGNVSVTFN